MGTPRLAKSLLLTCCARNTPCKTRATLLPFLYQTTTIQSFSTKAPRKAQRSRAAGSRDAKPRNFEQRSYDIPFENVEEHSEKPKGPIKAQKDSSSLSATERAAFEKLFEQLGKPVAPNDKSTSTKKGSSTQDASTRGLGVQSLSPEQRDVYLARLPESIRPLAETALQRITDVTKPSPAGTLGRNTAADNNEEAALTAEDDIDAQLEKHLDRIEALFDEQQSDLGVWKVLQSEMFEPLKLLDLDGARKGGKRSTKKGPPVSPTTTASPEMVLTSIPHVTLLALDYLHERYPSSQLPTSILPQLKYISRTAHTLALSPNLYASLLTITWTHHRSPSHTISLLQEMESEGVELERTVLAALLPIVQAATRMRDGTHGEPVRLLCSMEGWEDRLAELRRVWVPLVRRRIVDAAVREAHVREEQVLRDARGGGADGSAGRGGAGEGSEEVLLERGVRMG